MREKRQRVRASRHSARLGCGQMIVDVPVVVVDLVDLKS